MPILIDGYNLLHVAGILARNVGPRVLENARLALLNFLAESLPPDDVAKTTVVFDAHQPPWGAPRRVEHRGVVVLFAAGREDADSLIEDLIEQDHAPRQLTVVSSDRRLQRAAVRRKAQAVASDAWYAEVVRQRRDRMRKASQKAERPPVPLLAEDVEYWIRQFGGESELTRFIEVEVEKLKDGGVEAPPASAPPGDPSAVKPVEPERRGPAGPPTRGRKRPEKRDENKPSDPYNPFPPGYAEDLGAELE